MLKKTFLVFIAMAVSISTMGAAVYSENTVSSQIKADVDVEAGVQSETSTEAEAGSQTNAGGEASAKVQLITLQNVFAQLEGKVAAEVIAGLYAEGYSLNEIAAELKSAVVATEEASAQFKAYADALRAQIKTHNEARLSELLEARAQSNAQFEVIRDEQVNVSKDLAIIYE